MPSYAYVARDRNGQRVKGSRVGVSDAAVLSELRGLGLLVLEVHAAHARGAGARHARPGRFSFGPSAADVEVEVRQLAFMLKSGVTLLHALHIAGEQAPRRRMAAVMNAVADDIRDGSSLADALRQHRCFDRLTCSLVDVGERGGNLDVVLERAADALMRRRQLRTQMTTALIYPALVLLMAIATVAYMMVGIIPKLSQFLAGIGRRLPPSTQLLVDTSAFLRAHFVTGLLVFLGIVVAIWAASKTVAGRRLLDRTILRIPVIGRIMRLAAAATFSFNLALLVRSGVRITSGMQVVESILPLRLLGDRVARARQAVLQGAGLSESLARVRAFEPMVTGMIAIGETSGRLDDVLDNVAVHHDARLRELIRRLGTIIEPIILVVIGAIVGFVYLSFFAAIYSIAGR
jgi:type IV pilus assembly protein PilC